MTINQKKYKAHFSIWNLTRKTQQEVATIQAWVKGLTGILAASSLVLENPWYTLAVGAFGYLIDGILACIWLEEV
jgi:ElaB/YqjD/DUF883 family membrane-anchored ribosome-binding protein